MQSIKQIKNIKNKVALVRVDFNVPIKDGKVLDNFRIKKALPTIEYLQKKGAKVVLITHLGKGGESLLPVAKVLNKFIKTKFVPEIIGDKVEKIVSEMKAGEVILLENLRNNSGEQSADKNFAKSLANLASGGFYVNEAFSVSHRKDTSIVLIPKLLPAYAGLQLELEVKNLSKVLKYSSTSKNKGGFLFILGGAKFSTKMPLIKKYLKHADDCIIGGALLNDFLKAKGYEVGQSLVDDASYGIEKIIKNPKLILPVDVVVMSDGKLINKKVTEVQKDETILDIGSESVKMMEPYIKKAKLILWNGPFGKYEVVGGGATKKVLKMVAVSKAESIIGGGDTVALISQMKMEKDFTFVSTGGGATLDFLVDGTLAGIKILG